MNYNYNIIGNRATEERVEKGWSQDDLIDELGKIGVKIGRNKISAFENGRAVNVSLDFLVGLCKLYDCELGYLLCEDGYENKTRQKTDIVKATGLSEEAVDKLQDFKTRNCFPEFYIFISQLLTETKLKEVFHDLLSYFCDEYDPNLECKEYFNDKLIESITDTDNPYFSQSFNILNENIKSLISLTGRNAKIDTLYPDYKWQFIAHLRMYKNWLISEKVGVLPTPDTCSPEFGFIDLDFLNKYGEELVELFIYDLESSLDSINEYHTEAILKLSGKLSGYSRVTPKFSTFDEASARKAVKEVIEDMKNELSRGAIIYAE